MRSAIAPWSMNTFCGRFRRFRFPAEEVVFVDYGAGKGRALAAAAAQPFRKVIVCGDFPERSLRSHAAILLA